jgi:WD40 repeat protein
MDGGTSQSIHDAVVDPALIQDRQQFAGQLTRLRNQAGLSVRSVAKQLEEPAATIGGYFSGKHLPSVSQTDLYRRMLTSLGVEEEDHAAWVNALFRVRQKPGPRPAAQRCPYPGLESFRTEDSGLFFGREELTTAIVRRLARLIESGEPAALILVGASGSGKSSLLRAGVIPAVLEERLDGDRRWQPVLLYPGNDPQASLASALEHAGWEAPEIEASLERADLPELVTGSRGVLLVVDQFEELFTTCVNDRKRRSFLETITTLAASPGVAVVLALRADFYSRATEEPQLVPILQHNQVVVGPMSADELRRAILEPAKRTGIAVEDDLVELLLDEVAPPVLATGAHEPGVLPLLSHALRETWSKSRKGIMTVADYRSTGGISGAVQLSAEQTVCALTGEEQVLARRVMLRLVNVDETVTRRRALWSSLPGCMCGQGRNDECKLHRVVDRFVSARLLTAETETVEISHEALLTAWDRLRGWIRADREGIKLRREIGDAARMWEDSGRDSASLFRGGRLEIALAWWKEADRADLTTLETSFLEESVAQAESEKRVARKRLRRFQLLTGVATILALVAALLANVATSARNQATQARDNAQSRQLAIQASELRGVDSTVASQLALLAYQIAPTRQARSALIDSSALPTAGRILGAPGPTAVAVSPGGDLLAVSGAGDASVQLFHLGEGTPTRSGRLVVPGVAGDLYSVGFSPDGNLAATAATDGFVRLWNVEEPGNPQLLGEPLGSFDGAAWAAEFSPDGAILAAAGAGGQIYRWDIGNSAKPKALPPLDGAGELTQTLAYSPDGRLLAAGGTDGAVRLWSAAAGGAAPIVELSTGAETTVTSVAFSPDSNVLAAGSKDKLIRLWRLGGTEPTAINPPLEGFGSWVNDVAFSSDGKVLAGGGSDNSIRFWSVDGWQPIEADLTTSSPVTQLVFRPGRTDLVSVASDGTARLWNWPGAAILGASDNVFGLSYSSDGSRLAILSNKSSTVGIWDTSDRLHPARLGEVRIPEEMKLVGATGALSPDGKLLATGMTDFAVQIWDVADPAHPAHVRTLTGPEALIEGIVFSPDGRYLAAGGDDTTIRIWDMNDTSTATPAVTLDDVPGLILGLEFSRAGRLLAAAGSDKSVWLWDVSKLSEAKLLKQLEGFEHYAYSVAFNPEGTVLAAGSADKTVRLWDLTNPREPELIGGPLTGPNNYVFSVAFSPTEPVLSAAVTDGTVWQWGIADPQRPKVLTTLRAPLTTQVFAVKYSPDGRLLLGSDGKAVRLWEPDVARASRLICSTTGDGITRKEWEQYVPGLPYAPPCR